jgi:glycosyltransferase involved in cell wall biosynthesis
MSDKPLRVLHVLAELKPSGAETMLVAAAPLFKANGVEAEVLSTGAQAGPFAKRFEAAGYRIHHLPFTRSPLFFWKERQLMRAGDYDVIHLHTEQANIWHGLTALSVRPPILLRTIHNNFTFSSNLKWRRGMQRRILQRLGVRHVSVCASVRDTELRNHHLPTTLVWNWYESQRFTAPTPGARMAARNSFGLQEGEFVIASVGNCSRIKNHVAIIQAVAMLPIELRPVYLHAGIEDDMRSERELARDLGVLDNIRFLGGLPDVLPLLQAADAYVMPSLYEGFSIAALEALATGLPALFTDVSGLQDLRTYFPHLVYTGTSAEEIAMGLKRLLPVSSADKALIQQQYAAIARQRFGMERGVQEYLAIYRGEIPPQPRHGDISNAKREADA